MTRLLPGISVLVSVYNEARTVGQVLCQIVATLYEILVIDDGSTDASLAVVQVLDSSSLRISATR